MPRLTSHRLFDDLKTEPKKREPLRVPLEVKLWLGLDWDVPEGECWEWKGALTKYGKYGVIGLGKRRGKTAPIQRVHRVMYELVYEVKLAPQDTILHLCDNPRCANPDHLLRGSHVDNMEDMKVKARGRFKGLSENYSRFLYEKLKRRFEPVEGK